jgi:transposase
MPPHLTREIISAMKLYPEELKASIIARMLPPNNIGIPEISRDTGIPKDTLYT